MKKTVPVMGFDIDQKHYGIDLNEALDVIRDLLMVRSLDSRSMTGQFIRKNRRKTIVFDLAGCLALIGDGRTGRKNTSFLLLDNQIADSRVGILVPGIHSIRHEEYSKKRPGRAPEASSPTPQNRIIRSQPPQRGNGSRDTIPLINIRELVDSCICHLKSECSPWSPDGE